MHKQIECWILTQKFGEFVASNDNIIILMLNLIEEIMYDCSYKSMAFLWGDVQIYIESIILRRVNQKKNHLYGCGQTSMSFNHQHKKFWHHYLIVHHHCDNNNALRRVWQFSFEYYSSATEMQLTLLLWDPCMACFLRLCFLKSSVVTENQWFVKQQCHELLI